MGALYPGDAESPEDLVIRADRALREQKSSHGITNRRTRLLGFGETAQA